MNIALDFDDTFTRDPKLFTQFVIDAKESGHNVYCVTMRNDDELGEVRLYLGEYVDGIINTSRAYKYDYVREHGIRIDIWIDDNPFFITGSHR